MHFPTLSLAPPAPSCNQLLTYHPSMAKFKLQLRGERERHPLRGLALLLAAPPRSLWFVETRLVFCMIATAPGGAPKAVSALRRGVGWP